MKSSLKNRLYALCVLIVFAITAMLTVYFLNAKAEESAFDFSLLQGQCKNMTSTDAELDDYIEKVTNKVYTYEKNVEEQGKQLVKIVPRDCFYNDGTYFYQGDEYLFYVNTFANSSQFCDLLIVDYDLNYDATNEIFKTELRVFKRKYIKLYGEEYPRVYSFDDENLTKSEMPKFYLSIPKAYAAVYNEHEFNSWDKGYSKVTDEGKIIRQTRINYRGKRIERGEGDGVDVVQFVLGTAASLVPNPIDNVISNGIIDILKKASSIAKIAVNGIDLIEKFKNEEIEVVSDNENNIADFETKEHQRNSDEIEDYTKMVWLIPEIMENNNDNEFPIGCTLIDDYYNVITVLSNEPVVSGIKSGMIFDVYYQPNNSGNYEKINQENVVVNFEKTINQKFYDLAENTEAYLVEGGKQVFSFTPTLPSDYSLTAKSVFGTNIRVYSQYDFNSDNSEFIILPNEAGNRIPYNKDLKKYYIEVSLADKTKSDKFVLECVPNPPQMQVGDNTVDFSEYDELYYKFTCDKQREYIFTGSSSSVKLALMDEDFTLIKNSVNGTLTNKMTDVGHTYILKVEKSNFTGTSCNINISQKKKVQFNNSLGGEDFTVEILNDNELLGEIPTAKNVSGYSFNGWTFGEGLPIINENDLLSVDALDIYVYADYSIITYTIHFVVNGGNPIDDIEFNVHDQIQLEQNMSKDNCTFIGWYENADFSGKPVTMVGPGAVGDKTFYAKWVDSEYTVNLNVNSGSTDNVSAAISSTVQEIEYGQHYTLPVPELFGFIFQGWYNGENQYTDENGNSIFAYTDEQDIVLTAKWVRYSFVIKVDFGDGNIPNFKYLTNDSILSEQETVIEYVVGLCPHCWMDEFIEDSNNLVYYYKEGHIFKKLVTADGDIACWKNVLPALANGDVIELFAKYDLEEHTINFYNYPAAEKSPITAKYGETLNLVTEAPTGYTFSHWEVANTELNKNFIGNFSIGRQFNYNKMPDITVNQEKDATIYLNDVYIPNIYSITLVDGTQERVIYVSYGDTLSGVYVPSKAGHTFVGWIDHNGLVAINSSGVLVDYNGNPATWMCTYNIRVTARYAPNQYNINYVLNSGSLSGNYPTMFTYGLSIDLPTPTRTYYDFKGWYRNSSFSGTCYNNDTPFDGLVDGTVTFYAKWEQHVYKLIFRATWDETISATYGKTVVFPSRTNVYHTGKWKRDSDGELFNFGTYYTCQGKDETFTVEWTLDAECYVGPYVRQATYTIESGNVFNEDYDYVNIIDNLQARYYSKATVRIQFVAWEKDDGYQTICLYSGTGSSAKYLDYREFEHGGSKKNTSPMDYEFTFEVNVSDIHGNGNSLCVRYKATGAFGNTWYNSNMTCAIILHN